VYKLKFIIQIAIIFLLGERLYLRLIGHIKHVCKFNIAGVTFKINTKKLKLYSRYLHAFSCSEFCLIGHIFIIWDRLRFAVWKG